jgi:hypothetical protein
LGLSWQAGQRQNANQRQQARKPLAASERTPTWNSALFHRIPSPVFFEARKTNSPQDFQPPLIIHQTAPAGTMSCPYFSDIYSLFSVQVRRPPHESGQVVEVSSDEAIHHRAHRSRFDPGPENDKGGTHWGAKESQAPIGKKLGMAAMKGLFIIAIADGRRFHAHQQPADAGNAPPRTLAQPLRLGS